LTLMQSAAVLVLWRTRKFDTFDLAHLFGVHEADICRLLHAANERERGPDLRVVS
jgi:hypothetical protein